MPRLRFTSILLAAAAVAAAWPAAGRAEWLVGKDGSRLEVKGPWTVKGKMVVFTLANGTFGSMKAADVDLEASEKATAAATAATAAAVAPAAAAATRRSPVMVVTDADVSHGEVDAAPAAEDEAKPAGEASAAAGKQAVQVGSWDHTFQPEDGSVTIAGTVTNTGKNIAGGVSVAVLLFDDKGALLASAAATLASDTLPAGQSTTFSASIPGITNFNMVKFDIQSLEIKTRPAADSPN